MPFDVFANAVKMKKRSAKIWQNPAFGLLFVGFCSTAAAQEEVKRPPLKVPEMAETVLQFVPAGWRLEGVPNEVDLNADGKPDAAFVISHGGIAAPGDVALVVVKHVLVLALRGGDARLHRSIVSDAAVLDGDEGGVFGDPFEELSVDHGAVVIRHYGGSKDRWGYTHRYRYQNGQWMLVGLSFGNTDTLDLEHFDNHDINLVTGSAGASEKGSYEGQPKKRETSGSYYELEVLPVDHAPKVDGALADGEWPGYTVRLNEKSQVYRNRKLWRGKDDLSAQLQAVRSGKDLFLSAQVADNQLTVGDAVRLVTKKGLVIKPLESKLRPSADGHVFEARYSLETMVKASRPGDEYAAGALQERINSTDTGGDLEGFELPVSVEIVDVDGSSPRQARAVLSTRLFGSPYSGAIRIFRPGTLILRSDIVQ